MKRIKLFFLFLSYAFLALVNPAHPLDLLNCAENGAAARERGEHPLGHRAGDEITTLGWLVLLFVAATMAASVIVWSLK